MSVVRNEHLRTRKLFPQADRLKYVSRISQASDGVIISCKEFSTGQRIGYLTSLLSMQDILGPLQVGEVDGIEEAAVRSRALVRLLST